MPPARGRAGGRWLLGGPGPLWRCEAPIPSLPSDPIQPPPGTQGLRSELVCVHVRVCECVSVLCPFRCESAMGGTVESGPAGVAGILANPGRRKGEGLGTESPSKIKARDNLCQELRHIQVGPKWDRVRRGERNCGPMFLFHYKEFQWQGCQPESTRPPQETTAAPCPCPCPSPSTGLAPPSPSIL